MAINISADGNDEIDFSVKGKINLSLTSKGLVYRGQLVEDKGEVYRLMKKFLGLAFEEIQAHGQVVTQVSELTSINDHKEVSLVIQSSIDGDKPWASLFPEDIPEWVKRPDVIGAMMKGDHVQLRDNAMFYRGCRSEPESPVKH